MLKDLVIKFTNEILERLFAEEYSLDELNYDDFIAYYVKSRPDEDSVAKGAVFIEKKPGYYSIIQIFLDKNDNPIYASEGRVYGRKVKVKKIDGELKEFFGDEKAIIIE